MTKVTQEVSGRAIKIPVLLITLILLVIVNCTNKAGLFFGSYSICHTSILLVHHIPSDFFQNNCLNKEERHSWSPSTRALPFPSDPFKRSIFSMEVDENLATHSLKWEYFSEQMNCQLKSLHNPNCPLRCLSKCSTRKYKRRELVPMFIIQKNTTRPIVA